MSPDADKGHTHTKYSQTTNKDIFYIIYDLKTKTHVNTFLLPYRSIYMWIQLVRLSIKCYKAIMALYWPMDKQEPEKHTQCREMPNHHKPKELYQIHLPIYLDILLKPKITKSKIISIPYLKIT